MSLQLSAGLLAVVEAAGYSLRGEWSAEEVANLARKAGLDLLQNRPGSKESGGDEIVVVAWGGELPEDDEEGQRRFRLPWQPRPRGYSYFVADCGVSYWYEPEERDGSLVLTPHMGASAWGSNYPPAVRVDQRLFKAAGLEEVTIPLPERVVVLPPVPWIQFQAWDESGLSSSYKDEENTIFLLSEARQVAAAYRQQLDELLK